MRRCVATASRSACSFVLPCETVQPGSPFPRGLVILAVAPPSDSVAPACEGARASSLRGAGPVGAAASAPGELESRAVTDASDELAVDGLASEFGDIDSPIVAGDSNDPADDGSEPAVDSG